MTALLLALAAGVLTIAAPCILPILPILLGASVGQTSRSRPAFITLGFVVAFSLVALLFGVLMVIPHPFQWLAARMGGVVNRAHAIGSEAGSGNLGGFVLGMTLGVVWTPCAGPVLGSILTVVATSKQLGWSATLLLAYAVGAGIPMLAIAYGGQYVTRHVRSLAHHAHRMQQVFGVLVMLIAVAIYYQYDTLVTVWLSDFYPNATMGL